MVIHFRETEHLGPVYKIETIIGNREDAYSQARNVKLNVKPGELRKDKRFCVDLPNRE